MTPPYGVPVTSSSNRRSSNGAPSFGDGDQQHWSTVSPSSRRTWRLRTRVTLFFSVATLAASLSLGVVTYLVSRNFLLDQRTSVAKSQAFANAKSLKDELRAAPDTIGNFVLTQLPTEGAGCAVVGGAHRDLSSSCG